ncbi:ISAzo13 family transposase, partial [Streptomyces sp. NPDC059788]
LALALDKQRERIRHQQRGGARLRARGAGPKDTLCAADRILAAILYTRKIGTQELLGQLFQVGRTTITHAVGEVCPLLRQHGYDIAASTARFRTPLDVMNFLAQGDSDTEIKTAC